MKTNIPWRFPYTLGTGLTGIRYELCSQAERDRMTATTHVEDDGIELGTYTVEHPTRLHEQFVAINRDEYGVLIIGAEDLGDGWTRATYRIQAR